MLIKPFQYIRELIFLNKKNNNKNYNIICIPPNILDSPLWMQKDTKFTMTKIYTNYCNDLHILKKITSLNSDISYEALMSSLVFFQIVTHDIDRMLNQFIQLRYVCVITLFYSFTHYSFYSFTHYSYLLLQCLVNAKFVSIFCIILQRK